MSYCLVGIDGNAYSVMGYTQRAMKECNFTKEEIDAYLKDAMSADYNHLLCVSAEMIDKCNERCDDDDDELEMDDDTIEDEYELEDEEDF